MGSFNTVCVASGISMSHDQAALIPLTRIRFSKGRPTDLSGSSRIVSNDGASAFFVALTMPIFGQMDSYGRIDRIQADNNTAAIERSFGMPIQEFAWKVAEGSLEIDGFDAEDRPIKERVGGCFVQRQVWDFLSTRSTDEGGSDEYSIWNSSAALYPATLSMMGFEPDGSDKRRDRYVYRWKHPSHPNVTLWSDGRWCRLEWSNGSKTNPVVAENGGFYSPRDVAKALAEYGAGRATFSAAVRKRMRQTPTLLLTLEDQVPKIARMRDLLKRCADEKPGYLYLSGGEMLGYGLDPSFVDRFWPEIEGKILWNELVAWWTFLMNMYSLNRLLMPGMNGCQYGNHHAHLEMLELTADILRKKLRRSR